MGRPSAHPIALYPGGIATSATSVLVRSTCCRASQDLLPGQPAVGRGVVLRSTCCRASQDLLPGQPAVGRVRAQVHLLPRIARPPSRSASSWTGPCSGPLVAAHRKTSFQVSQQSDDGSCSGPLVAAHRKTSFQVSHSALTGQARVCHTEHSDSRSTSVGTSEGRQVGMSR